MKLSALVRPSMQPAWIAVPSNLQIATAVLLLFGTLLPAARGDILGPYTPDAVTLHLWHMDEAVAPVSDFATISNLSLTALANGATLGNASFIGYGTALSTADGGTAGGGTATAIDAVLSTLAPANAASDNVNWSFADPTTGAFTFEAIIRIDFNPLAHLGTVALGGTGRNTPMQIISGEQDGPGGGVRSWQFRLDPVGFNPNAGGFTTPLVQPALEFINVNNGASVQNIVVLIPTNGPNAIVSNNWYHVAVTYDGAAGTANNLKIYWTLLDASRTLAAPLLITQMNLDLNASGQVDFTIGNTGRTTPNNNFIGLIDEVRISSVARAEDQMVFTSPGVPPSFSIQPRNQFVAEGTTASLNSLASGSQPIFYQWQRGGMDLAGQTNTTLTFPSISMADAGEYRLIATNAFGGDTSVVAQITVGIGLLEAYGTGLDDSHGLLAGGSIDPHYLLVSSSDPAFPGPSNVVFLDLTPIPPYAANGPNSKWIGPRINTNTFPGNVQGTYVYRTTVVIDTTEPTNTILSGRWASDNDGLGIIVNGVVSGYQRLETRAFEVLLPFTITNALVAGSNIVDFVISNQPPTGATALRVDLAAIGLPLPPGLPRFTNQPRDHVFIDGHPATLEAVALGAPPLSYQWIKDGFALPGQTRRVLKLAPAIVDDSGEYRLVVSNNSGSVTSEVAQVIVRENSPPVANTDGFVTALTRPLFIPYTLMLANDTDPDGQPLTVTSVDASGLIGGTVATTNGGVIYTPPGGVFPEDIDFIGYAISDGFGGTASGEFQVQMLEEPVPAYNRVVIMAVAGGYRLRYVGQAGHSYTVLRASNVAGPYTPLTTATASAFGVLDYDDLMPLAEGAFYRIGPP